MDLSAFHNFLPGITGSKAFQHTANTMDEQGWSMSWYYKIKTSSPHNSEKMPFHLLNPANGVDKIYITIYTISEGGGNYGNSKSI